MKYIQFIELCRSKNWSELQNLFANGLELPHLIAVSAIIETYNKDENFRKRFGLSYWNSNLTNKSTVNLFYGVDLLDFFKAYRMVTNGFSETLPGLNDDNVAKTLRDYVHKNKLKLAKILLLNEPRQEHKLTNSEWQECKAYINAAFGDLTITDDEIEKKRTDKAYKKALGEKISKKIQILFQLPQNSGKVEVNKYCPSVLKFSESMLSNSDKIKTYKKYWHYLETLGLSFNFYLYPEGCWNTIGFAFNMPLYDVFKKLDSLPNQAIDLDSVQDPDILSSVYQATTKAHKEEADLLAVLQCTDVKTEGKEDKSSLRAHFLLADNSGKIIIELHNKAISEALDQHQGCVY